ncbi:hypothetical protein [Rosistilla oblonga]|uniref:hypothetical protein n=1 Tax=Rosistilla oblonga TaxID=2527990 RepID=UPI003A977A5C
MTDIHYYFVLDNPTKKMHFKCCVCKAFHKYKDGKAPDGKMFAPSHLSRAMKMEYSTCEDHIEDAKKRLKYSLIPDYSDAAFQLGIAP